MLLFEAGIGVSRAGIGASVAEVEGRVGLQGVPTEVFKSNTVMSVVEADR